MFSWAKPDYLLDFCSLDQLVLYHRYGWEAKKTDARVFFGVLGQLIAGDDKKIISVDKFKELHPDGAIKNGAWQVSR